jgi:hypothetical protein
MCGDSRWTSSNGKLRSWIRRVWQRDRERADTAALRSSASYRLCTELWRLPTREPSRKETA